MSEASAAVTRPDTVDRVTDAGWTDCDLDPSIGGDSEALARLGITRAVFSRLPRTTVTLSPELASHNIATRFVIPAPPNLDPAMLRELHAQGVRGVRFVLADDADRTRAQLDRILRYADRIAGSEWHIELGLGSGETLLSSCEWTLMRFPVAVCLGGLGGCVARRASENTELQFILTLLQIGRTWIKLSGAASDQHDSDARTSLKTFAAAAVAARRDRIVWGSGRLPDRGLEAANTSVGMAHVTDALATLKAWIPDDNDRDTILTANPSQLYGFGTGS